jgi:hypothetical protein
LNLEKAAYLNVHGTRIATKTQNVATGTAHKLNLNESAESSQRASGAARMARNAINDTANLKLVWNERLNQGKAFFHQIVTPPCTTHPLLSADRPPIAV